MSITNPLGAVEATATTLTVQCPHCVEAKEPEWKTWVLVDRKELNCRIFRHGIMKKPYETSRVMVQIPPHASKVECDRLAREGLIIGCGKPYKIIDEVQKDGAGAKVVSRAVICDYI
jgi:hypothetical protein